MTINPEFFNKVDYSFHGIFRGVVEDNADPLDAGRVRVRIFSIHNFDGKITPVEQLPWAEPALGLAWSGGRNVLNNDYKPEDTRKAVKDGRYNVSDTVSTDNTPKNTFEAERVDPITNECGTGGQFVVPKRGNWVFLFFEGGNHNKPIYFAMAPNVLDWQNTKTWRTQELDGKVLQISKFREEFVPKEAVKASNDSWAKNAIVNSLVDKPDLTVQIPNNEGGLDSTNRDIQCMTSANGTTIIIDQRNGAEQIFVIHKNYMEYTDKFGNRKIYVGKKRGVDNVSTKSDLDEPCHLEVGVEGNHEIHVLGNYDLYAKGRIHIQCDSHAQIDVRESAGILVREGDVDLIIQKGNMNADIAGNADIDIKKNLNAHIVGQANIKVDNDAKITTNGNLDVAAEKDIRISAGQDINMTATSFKFNATTTNFDTRTVKVSGSVHVGESVRIGGQTDISGQVRIGNQLFVERGIDCGGTLVNRGKAELGSPVIAHGLQVVGGTGPGIGARARSGESPDAADSAEKANRVEGVVIVKSFGDKTNGDPDPSLPSDLVYNKPQRKDQSKQTA